MKVLQAGRMIATRKMRIKDYEIVEAEVGVTGYKNLNGLDDKPAVFIRLNFEKFSKDLSYKTLRLFTRGDRQILMVYKAIRFLADEMEKQMKGFGPAIEDYTTEVQGTD